MNVTIIGAGNMGRGIGTRAVAGGHLAKGIDSQIQRCMTGTTNSTLGGVDILAGNRLGCPSSRENRPTADPVGPSHRNRIKCTERLGQAM